jgi:F0F1-type ATP synthase assembly protein I
MPGKDDVSELIRRVAPFVGLGAVFAASLGLLALAGHWADGRLGTTPWLTLAGIVLGLITGFYSFFATVLRNPPR